jgi:ATP-dependent helicase/nuclease subunit B
MAVRFIIGRAGTGKTRRCFDAIVAAAARDPLGEPIYWIVPKQATFQAERELTCAGGLDGFCRIHVVSFELLGEMILADCGGAAVPQVTAAGRQMVLGHLLRENADRLQFFKSVARQAGLAAELDTTFAEFERSGRDVEDLKTLAADLEADAANDPQAASLLAKFRDLHLLYDEYTKYLGQDRLDPHRRLVQVLECVEHCKLIQGAHVYVDGFHEFTDFERRTLAGVARVCKQMEITLLLDPASPVNADPHFQPNEMSLFFRTEQTYKKLWFTFNEEKIQIDAPVLLSDANRFENPYLSHAEKHLFSAKRQAPAMQSRGVEMVVAPDRRAEVDAAARCIQQCLLNGMRLRDIAVLARHIESYSELIDASFREHNIAYFIDRRRPAVHHPLPQVVRAIFLVALHNWHGDGIITLLKSGLCGLELTEADEVENYVITHRIRGEMWASKDRWRYVRKLTRGEDDEGLSASEQFELERIDGLRRTIVDPLRPFFAKITPDSKLKIREYILELFAVLERYNVRKTMLDWIKSTDDLEQQGEHQQVWAELVKLLDQMAEIMGEEVVSTQDFLAILDSGLEQFDLALTPPTVDQVLVGGVERTRTPALKACIVLGLNEGEFPHAPRDQTILSDGERRKLRERNIEIDPDGDRKLLDESFLGYIAFTRASHRLYVTRSAADDAGRPVMPSPFWKKIRGTFPDAPTQEIRREEATVQTIGTPRQLVTRLMRWVRDGAYDSHSPVLRVEGWGEGSSGIGVHAAALSSNAPNPSPAPTPRNTGKREDAASWIGLYHWLAMYKCSSDFRDPIDTMRYRAWRALSYDNQASLSPEIAKLLFKSPLDASVSRVETFATCPFKHFARYTLKLTEREDPDVSSLDLGNVYHGILEQLVGDMVRRRKRWGAEPKNVTQGAIRKFSQAIGESLRGELMLSSARNQYLLNHIERTLDQIIDSQEAAAARGKFNPIRTELEFGLTGESELRALELTTAKGNRLRLRGKIDRVDLLEDQAAFAVIDYKLSGSALSLDRVYHGISLQLLTYLLVLQANGEALAGKPLTPAAAFYVQLLRQLDDVDHPNDATDPEDEKFHLQVKPRGLLHRRFLNAIDDQLTPGTASEVVAVRLNKDGAIGLRRSSDAAEHEEFAALMRHVEMKLAELGDEIVGGRIDIAPYRMNGLTPCPACEYRAVCRFDTLTNRYHHLTVLGREGVLEKLAQEAGHAG